MTTIEAVYEHGVLRLKGPIALDEGAHVDVIVIERRPDPRRAAEIIAKITTLAQGPGEGEPASGRDHDKVLYGDQGAR